MTQPEQEPVQPQGAGPVCPKCGVLAVHIRHRIFGCPNGNCALTTFELPPPAAAEDFDDPIIFFKGRVASLDKELAEAHLAAETIQHGMMKAEADLARVTRIVSVQAEQAGIDSNTRVGLSADIDQLRADLARVTKALRDSRELLEILGQIKAVESINAALANSQTT